MGALTAETPIDVSPHIFMGEQGPPDSMSLEAFYADLQRDGLHPAEDVVIPWETSSLPAEVTEQQVATRGTLDRLRHITWGRVGRTVVVGGLAIAALTACRGEGVDAGDPVDLNKGTAIYDYASDEDEKDTTAEKCGETRADVHPFPRRQYTDPEGKSWWGFSANAFSTDGECDSTGLLWVPK